MVNGLEIFREYFKDYAEQYVLIGGTACDISFSKNDIAFRATRDLDMVIIVEAQTKEFGDRFWEFIKAGKYQNKSKSSNKPQFYRFEKPQIPGYPAMIELFARTTNILHEDSHLTPIRIDETVSSLSAILLDDAYYELLLKGRKVSDGISYLGTEWILPFKAKAWLDLTDKKNSGITIDSRDIKKHRNDILRIASLIPLTTCEVSDKIKNDLREFLNSIDVTNTDLKNLGMSNVTVEAIKETIGKTYSL